MSVCRTSYGHTVLQQLIRFLVLQDQQAQLVEMQLRAIFYAFDLLSGVFVSTCCSPFSRLHSTLLQERVHVLHQTIVFVNCCLQASPSTQSYLRLRSGLQLPTTCNHSLAPSPCSHVTETLSNPLLHVLCCVLAAADASQRGAAQGGACSGWGRVM